jgi:acyl carrier protein
MENKIKNVMSSVFDVNVNEILEDTNPDSLDNWDSMAHMNLIVGLEEEFNILFDEDEITEMLNFKLICLIISEKI